MGQGDILLENSYIAVNKKEKALAIIELVF